MTLTDVSDDVVTLYNWATFTHLILYRMNCETSRKIKLLFFYCSQSIFVTELFLGKLGGKSSACSFSAVVPESCTRLMSLSL